MFAHQALLWGLLIVGVPVLIHLINMLRHRRVEWAAMEFLLHSQKKHRTWIILKQLLLLLMRMTAIALVVLMVAQPGCSNRLGSLFGTSKTHHIVLLDDSFSMSDRFADSSAFLEAKKVIQAIGDEATRPTQPQTFTLLRFSKLARFDRSAALATAERDADAQPPGNRAAGPADRFTEIDLLEQPVNRTDFSRALAKTLGAMRVSETAAGPLEALQAIEQLLGDHGTDRQILYLVSDFRAREWDDPTELRRQLGRLRAADVELHLINCVERARSNLAITSLVPAKGVCAAGVPFFMEVTVRNYAPTIARDVAVLLEEDEQTRPAATIAEMPAGGEVTERFQVRFTAAGEHEITARLQSDAVAVDNFRFATVTVPADVSVLLVDGDAEAFDARFLNVASAPGGPVHTGIRARIETPRYLSQKPLDEFHAVNVANFERLDASAVDALERYVIGGGGLAVFLGPKTDARFINENLYRDGQGLFPLPVAGETDLLVDRLDASPDVDVEPHFIFRVFEKQRNTFLNTVNVRRYVAALRGWRPPPDSATRILARLRNGAPLVVERQFGEGRVVVFLTSAAPLWNNWARNPSFVVVVQDLQAYLARRPPAGRAQLVGLPLRLVLDPQEYFPQVRFDTPVEQADPSNGMQATAMADGILAATLSDTFTSGPYRVRLTRKADGAVEVRHYAINVDAEEGNLAAISGTELAARLPGVTYEYAQASMFDFALGEDDYYDLSRLLLYALVALLILEQILAYSASYHPPLPRKGTSEADAMGGKAVLAQGDVR